jgi:hypothetical protein
MVGLIIWKLVVAMAAIVLMLNALTIAVTATRDAYQLWYAPRAQSE